MYPLKEFVLKNDVFVVAHRGSSGTAPENTMEAYRQAIDAGAQMIEIDVHITSDGNLITFHENPLIRTDSGEILNGDFSLNNVAKLDAGAWFDKKFSGERVPLLEDVISFLKNKAYLNIEIKSHKTEDVNSMAMKIVDLVKKYNMEDKVLFASFDNGALAYLKQINPTLHTASIKLPWDNTLPSKIAAEINCQAYICSIDEINEEICNDAEANGIYIGIYSVDTEEELRKIQKYKIKAIATNYPARIIEALKQR